MNESDKQSIKGNQIPEMLKILIKEHYKSLEASAIPISHDYLINSSH